MGTFQTQLDQALAGVDITSANLFAIDATTYRSPNFLKPSELPVVRNQQTMSSTSSVRAWNGSPDGRQIRLHVVWWAQNCGSW